MQVFIYGGCSSGKSFLAEQMAQSISPAAEKHYIATMWPAGHDAEQRIARHQSMRADKGFLTIERYTDVGGALVSDDSVVLLECVGNLVANELFEPQGAGPDTEQSVLAGVHSLHQKAAHLIIVSNDVGSDGVTYTPETLNYQRVLGRINQILCDQSDVCIEMVCGIPIFLKGEQLCRSYVL